MVSLNMMLKLVVIFAVELFEYKWNTHMHNQM